MKTIAGVLLFAFAPILLPGQTLSPPPVNRFEVLSKRFPPELAKRPPATTMRRYCFSPPLADKPLAVRPCPASPFKPHLLFERSAPATRPPTPRGGR